MNLRFKTSWLSASPKKLKAVTTQMKGNTLDHLIAVSHFSKKSFSKALCKDLKGIKSNLINVRGIAKDEAAKIIVAKACIEKKMFFQGYRMKARGHLSVSRKQICVINIYLIQKKEQQ